MMKRLLLMLLSFALCLSATACGSISNGGSTGAPDEPVAPSAPDSPYTLVRETTADKYSDEEGNLIASYSYAVVRMKPAEGAGEETLAMAETFNREMDALLERCLETGEELDEWAVCDPMVKQGAYYTDEVTVSWERVGDFLSIGFVGYCYSGGAHPFSNCYSYLFDLERGAYIDPLEIADDPELLRAAVTELLLAQIDSDPEYREGVFEDYAATAAHWNNFCVRLGEDGIMVAFAPYVLGPYAMGTVEFCIDYDEIRSALGENGVARLGI